MPNVTLDREQLYEAIDEYIGQANAGAVLRAVSRAYGRRMEREPQHSGHRTTFSALSRLAYRLSRELDAAEEVEIDEFAGKFESFADAYSARLDNFLPVFRGDCPRSGDPVPEGTGRDERPSGGDLNCDDCTARGT